MEKAGAKAQKLGPPGAVGPGVGQGPQSSWQLRGEGGAVGDQAQELGGRTSALHVTEPHFPKSLTAFSTTLTQCLTAFTGQLVQPAKLSPCQST